MYSLQHLQLRIILQTFSEIIGTAILCLGILFIGVNKIADGMNPLIVGGLIVAIGLSLGGPTDMQLIQHVI